MPGMTTTVAHSAGMPVVKSSFGQHPRRQQPADEVVDQPDRQLARRQQDDQIDEQRRADRTGAEVRSTASGDQRGGERDAAPPK